MKNMKKVTPQRLLQMIDPAAVLDVIEDAAAMYGDTSFAVIITDPRSLQGRILIAAACAPAPDDDAAARERVMHILRGVERATREVERTGSMRIQYACAPLDVLGAHLDFLDLPQLRQELERTGGDDPSILVFGVDEAAVASMELRPRAIGAA